jgi:putative peptidoglycan lipid II flippase
MIMPQAAIAQSIATAALPTFSAQVARGKAKEMRSSLAASLRGVLLLAVPASLGLVLLRRPLVAALYQRGNFSAESTQLVAWALLWYGAGLVGHCVVEIVARAFYALHDTKTPVMVGVAAMTLNLGFSLLFSALFTRWGLMPHGGLALANSLATFLEMIGLLYLMRRRLNGLEGSRVWKAVAQASLAVVGMGAGVAWWLMFSQGFSVYLITLGGVVIGVAIYAVLLIVQRTPEVQWGWNVLRAKMGRQE